MFKVHARRRSDMEKSVVFETRFRRLCVYCQEKVHRSNRRGKRRSTFPSLILSPARAHLPMHVFLCLLSGGLIRGRPPWRSRRTRRPTPAGGRPWFSYARSDNMASKRLTVQQRKDIFQAVVSTQ